MDEAETGVSSWTQSEYDKKEKVSQREVGVFCDLAGLVIDVLFYIYPSYRSLKVIREPNHTISIHLMIYWLVSTFFLLYEKYVWIYYEIGLQPVRRVISIWFIIPVVYTDLVNTLIPMITGILNNAITQVHQAMTRNVWNLSGIFMNQRVEADNIASVQQNLLNFNRRNRNEPQIINQPPNASQPLEQNVA